MSGPVLVVAGTGFTVLLVPLFNVISELTGGFRLSVIELDDAPDTTGRHRPAERLPAGDGGPDRPGPTRRPRYWSLLSQLRGYSSVG